MSIEVTARNKDIPASLQDYAKRKAAAFEADFPKTTAVHFVLDVERHLYKAQATATVCGTQFVGAGEDPENFMTAVDEAADKLYRQARKQQDRVGDNRKP